MVHFNENFFAKLITNFDIITHTAIKNGFKLFTL